MSNDIGALHDTFGIPDQLNIATDAGGLPVVQIRNEYATATVALQGAQVTAFQPRGEAPVLFVSKNSIYAPGKSIRGGIPVCWPWFGPHPTDPSKPSHGFVRTMMWQVLATASAPHATLVRLGLSDTPETRALWPHPFALQLVISVGASLDVELIARNPGETPWTYTGALHSYLAIGHIDAVRVHGLEGVEYLDKVADYRRTTQDGAVTISSETDRVYLDTTATCVVEDPAQAREIVVQKSGSRTTVVWNPWEAKAQTIADFEPAEYRKMVCVETANAADDQITVACGGEQRLRTVLRVAHS